jgi:hypothetical protein
MKKDTVILVGVVALAGLLLVDKLKGLFSNQQAEANNKTIEAYQKQAAINNPFDRRYIKAIQQQHPAAIMHYMTGASAQALAKKIYNSVGFWTGILPSTKDYTHEIQAAFQQIGYKTQVSQLANVFYDLYKKDLLTFLQYDTDKYGLFSGSKHSAIVNSILQRVKALPAY